MVASTIVIAVATAVGDAILSVGAELALSEGLTKARAKLDQWRKQGRYEEIQHALERAQQFVLSKCDSDEQRAVTQEVLNTLLNEAPKPLVDVFKLAIEEVYTTAGGEQFDTSTLATTYRKVSNPLSWVQGKLPNEHILKAIFGAFLAAFHEQLLREPTFSFLREYEQLTATKQQLNLNQKMLEHLEAIRVNTAHPVKVTPQLQDEYFSYLANELREITLRGFAPQVAGRVLSLPLADVFLPLTATEGRPVLASYAQEDLRGQAELIPQSEIYRQQYQLDLEKRHAQFRAQLATQQTLALADLVKEPRVVILGDPGTGKSTLARYIAYALAVRDPAHVGSTLIGCVPILIRVALYAQALQRDSTLHLIDYIERELLTKSEFGTYIRAEVEVGRCLIILDGLDEVSDPNLRVRVTERIQAASAAYSLNHFLVTSRVVGYEQSRLTRDFRHATIKPMTAAEQQRFIHMWYTAIERAVVDQSAIGSANDLIDTFERKPGIARIAANPLLLTIIVLMHWRGVKMPGRRVQVYQIATDTLLEHWTTLRGFDIDAEIMKALLAPIAHFILSRSVSGVISHYELLPLLYEGIIEHQGVDQAESKRQGRIILKVLNEQSGLFLERGYDDNQQPVYGFLHQTFGEYLAALHLASQVFSGTFSL